MQARAAIKNEAEILKCEHHGLAHLKRCLHPQGYRGAIIESLASNSQPLRSPEKLEGAE